MNPSRLPEDSNVSLEKHLRVLKNAPAPDLARGRARVLREMEKRRAHVSEIPRRLTYSALCGAAMVLVFLMAAQNMMASPQVTTVALTRTDTTASKTFAAAALPGNVLTPALNHSAAQTPAPNIAPEPPRTPLTNTRSVSPTTAN